MISSVVVTKDMNMIHFTKIEIDIVTGKMKTHLANFEITEELREHVINKHRVYLPCKIITDQDIEYVPYNATLYVPVFWEDEAIENYTQALLDELYLFKHNLPGCKNLKQIEQSFGLEMLLL